MISGTLNLKIDIAKAPLNSHSLICFLTFSGWFSPDVLAFAVTDIITQLLIALLEAFNALPKTATGQKI